MNFFFISFSFHFCTSFFNLFNSCHAFNPPRFPTYLRFGTRFDIPCKDKVP